jgi:4'-phosphopantetheinyl transferase
MTRMTVLAEHAWPISSGFPVLCEDQVHVWHADLDQDADGMDRLARVLCDAERIRAERFRFDRDRSRFLARRGILRHILGGYLSAPADELQFCYGRYGKLHLAGEPAHRGLRFSLSHSDGMAVFAFSVGHRVGVDLERVHTSICWEEIAAHALSRWERRQLQSLTPAARRRAFFTAWTCKEAYVKAKGFGLSFPLDRIDIGLSPVALRRVGGDELEASRWSLQELVADRDYAGALAVEGHDRKLVRRQWQSMETG